MARAGPLANAWHQQACVGEFRCERPAVFSRLSPRANTRAPWGEYSANNALWLRKLRDEGTVKILKFDDSILKAFLAVSKDVVAEAGSGNELSRKVYASYQQFRELIIDWSGVAEGAYQNSRRLA